MHILVLQHERVEHPGIFRQFLADDGHTWDAIELDEIERVVHALRAPGGLSLFGLQIVDPTHRVEVQFLTGPDCAAVLDPGEPWPTSYPECSSAVDVEGEVGSLGNTGTGRSLVGVIFVVSGGCYDLLERGMPWPPADPECVG